MVSKGSPSWELKSFFLVDSGVIMYMNRNFPAVLLMSTIFFLFSCSALKQGIKKYELGQYDIAINHFDRAIGKKGPAPRANFLAAESYRLSNRIEKAAPYYQAALEQGVTEEEALFYAAFALKANGEYGQAREQLEKYLESGKNREYISWARKEIRNLRYITDLLEKDSYYDVRHIQELNSEAAEYAPVYNNGEIFFTSNREGGKIYKATGTAFTDIYKAKMEGAKILPGTEEMLAELINTDKVNEGAVTFSNDGTLMIFARGNSGRKKGTREVNLYMTRYRTGSWSKPELLSINDPDSWDSTPAFSRDGRTLYFASNREGGYGGIDLYSAVMNANGRFSNLKNMGKDINTEGDEMFPWVSPDGKLYFSSSGHPSLGGLDLFVAVRKEGLINVENLGVPMNSPKDDFALTYLTRTKGYFSSNRDGGKGDDDIYAFTDDSPDQKIVNYYLTGLTVTVNDTTGEEMILPNTYIELLDAQDNLLERNTTEEDGKFLFKVEPERTYSVTGTKSQFFTAREPFSTMGKTIAKDTLTEPETDVFFDIKLTLDQIVLDKSIVLDNIYYDLDKANIRPDAAIELNKLVALLEDNPEIKIELSSHTDVRADDDYNLNLSQRRADSAVAYIISQGIEKNRIRARGYGESQLIVKNAQTEEEHQKNRRTEFKVYEYNPYTQRMEEIGNTAVTGIEEEAEEEVDDPDALSEQSENTEGSEQPKEKDPDNPDGNQNIENLIDWDEEELQE